MFNKKTLDAYRKKFGNIEFIKARIAAGKGDEIYVKVKSGKVKAKCLNTVSANKDCVVFRSKSGAYFLLCENNDFDIDNKRNIEYRHIQIKPKRESLDIVFLVARKVYGKLVTFDSTFVTTLRLNSNLLDRTLEVEKDFNFLLPNEVISYSVYDEFVDQSPYFLYDNYHKFGISYSIPNSLDMGYSRSALIEYPPPRLAYTSPANPLYASGNYLFSDEDPGPGFAYIENILLPGSASEPPQFNYNLVESGGNNPSAFIATDYFLKIKDKETFITRIYHSAGDYTDSFISSSNGKIYVQLKTWNELNILNGDGSDSENFGYFQEYFRNRLFVIQGSNTTEYVRDNIQKINQPSDNNENGFYTPGFQRLGSPASFPVISEWRENVNSYTLRNNLPAFFGAVPYTLTSTIGQLQPDDMFLNVIKNKVYRISDNDVHLFGYKPYLGASTYEQDAIDRINNFPGIYSSGMDVNVDVGMLSGNTYNLTSSLKFKLYPMTITNDTYIINAAVV